MKSLTYSAPGMELTEHVISVPLDYRVPEGRQIDVFAREVRDIERSGDDLPYLLYLQGGPGFEAPRPVSASGWIKHAIKHYAVILMDQRGTGLSTPLTAHTLQWEGDVSSQAEYASHFRADSIVKDAESLRQSLIGDRPWSVLGQSFGGFCAVHYLSAAPAGLDAVLITGGLPPLQGHADEVYRATYRRVLRRNRRYFERYPDDRERIRNILAILSRETVNLPNGTRLTPEVFQQVGMALGASDGFERIHYLVRDACVRGPSGYELSDRFLYAIMDFLPFDVHPIYALLHESIYCQAAASEWSAHRIRAQYPEFDVTSPGDFHFVGEMVFPWMFDHYTRLQPLKEVAEKLAAKNDWKALYDFEALRRNQVPCAAVIYDDDMYVERAFSSETADAIGGMKTWITNEFDHNGLRIDGGRILKYLLDLVAGIRNG